MKGDKGVERLEVPRYHILFRLFGDHYIKVPEHLPGDFQKRGTGCYSLSFFLNAIAHGEDEIGVNAIFQNDRLEALVGSPRTA